MIPARNEEKTILKTLNSIKNQSYKNLQVVVVDDNSSDKTKKIVNKFKKGFRIDSDFMNDSKNKKTHSYPASIYLKQ